MLPLSARRALAGSARLGPVALAALALAPCGCSKPLSQAECNGLLDRYVEKLVGMDRPDTPPAEVFRLQAETRARAAQDPAFGECSERVSRRAFDCAMDAVSADEMEQCLL